MPAQIAGAQDLAARQVSIADQHAQGRCDDRIYRHWLAGREGGRQQRAVQRRRLVATLYEIAIRRHAVGDRLPAKVAFVEQPARRQLAISDQHIQGRQSDRSRRHWAALADRTLQ